jgi:chloramphenicol O-acetyltransferase type A
MQYDKLAVNTIVTTKDGDISTCDLPYSEDFQTFARDYTRLTKQVHDTCEAYDASENHMVIGTSALTQTEIDGAINIYAGFYNNPFLIWGKYRKNFFHTTLPLSFQFHHTQMDGGHAAQFLENLQQEIKHFNA